MPTYQYACTECDHRFEQVQKFTDDALSECPVCHGRLRKVYNAVGVVFKGSGFYRTDSRQGAGSDPASSSGSSSGSSEKPSGGASEKSGSSTSGSSEKTTSTSSSDGSTSGSTSGSSSSGSSSGSAS